MANGIFQRTKSSFVNLLHRVSIILNLANLR